MFKNIDKYLDATCSTLAIQCCSGYSCLTRALVCSSVENEDYIEENALDMCLGEFETMQLEEFFSSNIVIPTVRADTPSRALKLLDKKLGLLYEFNRITPIDSIYDPMYSVTAKFDFTLKGHSKGDDFPWNRLLNEFLEAADAEPIGMLPPNYIKKPKKYPHITALRNIHIPTEIQIELENIQEEEEPSIFRRKRWVEGY